MEKTCNKCKWCDLLEDCTNPEVLKQSLEYLVTGFLDCEDCYDARKDENICGREGKYWEERISD